jgi:hypothetical protein
MPTYKIIRRYFKEHDAETIAEGLTLREAKRRCNDPETSSRTCKEPENVERTERCGPWFDGYTEEQ